MTLEDRGPRDLRGTQGNVVEEKASPSGTLSSLPPSPPPPPQQEFVLRDVEFAGHYGRRVFRTLHEGFRPQYPMMTLLIGVGLAARFLVLLSSWIAGQWVDSLRHVPSAGSSGSFLAGYSSQDTLKLMALVAALSFVLNILYRVPFTRRGVLGASNIYDTVTKHTSRLPQGFFDRTPVGRIISRFSSDYGAVLRMAGGPLGEFMVIIFDLLLLCVFIAATHWALLPVVFMTVLLNFLVYRSNRESLRESRRTLSLMRGPSIAHIAETSQGHATIRLFGKAETFELRFMVLVRDYMKSRLGAARAVQQFSFGMVVATASLLVLTAAIGLWLFQRDALSVGEFALAFTYVTLLSGTTQQFFDYLGRFDEALTGVERLGEYLSLEVEPGAVSRVSAESSGAEKEATKGSLAELKRGGEIEVIGLKFRYAPHLPLVLGGEEGLSLSIRSGEKFGIIGRTGSGKSSLLSALYYLYPFDSGVISVSHKVPDCVDAARFVQWNALRQSLVQTSLGGESRMPPMESVPLADYRRQMVLIAQEPVLFRGRLRENLQVAGRSLSVDEMESALEQVGLGDWLVSLDAYGTASRRLEYAVTEGGANLSAGQRQLVCMARALLEDSPVLVMDEATSFVDPRSEEKLLSAAQTTLGSKTQVRVAHRLATLEDCDRILWLDQGRVVAVGPASEILRRFRSKGGQNGQGTR